MPMRSEEEIRKQIVGVRDRVKELSGFWLGEGAAMLYVLEWALGKRQTAPAGELGSSGGDSEKIAANLAKLAEKAAAQGAAAAKAGTSGKAVQATANPATDAGSSKKSKVRDLSEERDQREEPEEPEEPQEPREATGEKGAQGARTRDRETRRGTGARARKPALDSAKNTPTSRTSGRRPESSPKSPRRARKA